ncbi:MAG: Glu/Leu/Phe/Val dehydrogenase [Bacteroidia bacterium]|nr:leucine dehydrogenase [Bacteroidia bacterium]MDW8158219.1 Glu/Leu/Phe/Val dehydrogenase [Bacteroidia bacterium]
MINDSLFTQVSSLGHEQVMFCYDEETGLRAIIAIHNTVLGPSLGGLRFWHYEREEDALFDVLRLSRGMTFKSSLAGLHLGGGKAVIIGDSRKIKTEALLRRFAKFVENLNGKYITAEDVGVDEHDMEYIFRETKHVAGLPLYMGGSGDPSPFTAYGVYLGMKAALKYQTGSESLENKKVIVQGAGKVGTYLIERLHKENAIIYVFDINEANLKHVVKEYKAIAVNEAEIYKLEADIYAPCALGGTVNPQTIPQLKVSLIAGGANNQLLDEIRDGKALQEKGIIYAPDFLINAGGVINVYTELEGYNEKKAYAKVERIYDTTLKVLKKAEEEKTTPQEAAIALATDRINQIAQIKKFI